LFRGEKNNYKQQNKELIHILSLGGPFHMDAPFSEEERKKKQLIFLNAQR
jgi:hypothetical protein